MSRLAIWSSRMAWFALAVALLSIVIVRSGLLEIMPALSTFAAALICAVLAVLLAIAAFAAIWRQGLTGIGRAIIGLVLGGALIAYPSYLVYRAGKLPVVTDITTDFANPPRFDVLARLRPRGTSDYKGATLPPLQRAAYPDVAPLQVEMPVKGVYDIALKLIAKRRWLVVDQRPPAGNRREATIEAVARTPIMGFRDDVVIRISALRNGARVDMRSASRYSFQDFGDNAKRVRALLDELDDAVSAAPEPRAEPEKPEKPPAKPAKKPAPKHGPQSKR